MSQGLSIANNLLADSARLNLDDNQRQLQRVVTQLSSGLRINSAADDPSGLAISTNLQTQVAAFNQGANNVQEATNALTVADGAIGAITGMLQRMRTLAIEAASDVSSAGDRADIQAEIEQLILEINRISQNANFNGLQLLSGNPTFLGPAIPIAQPAFQQAASASSGGGGVSSLTVTFPTTPKPGDLLVAGVNYFFPGGQIVTPPPGWTQLDNQLAVFAGYSTYMHIVQPGDPASYTWNFSVNNAVSVAIVDVSNVDAAHPIDAHAVSTANFTNVSTTPIVTPTSNDLGVAFTGIDGGSPPSPPTNPAFSQVTYTPAIFHQLTAQVDPNVAAGVPVGTGTVWGSASFSTGGMIVLVGPEVEQSPIDLPIDVHSGAAEGATVQIALPNVSSSILGVSGLDVSTFASAESAIGTCDSALQTILEDRAQLGAQMVALGIQSENNNTASVNLEAAASQIEDVNVGQASTTYTRLQILVQVGASVLAQSNVNALSVLPLFR